MLSHLLRNGLLKFAFVLATSWLGLFAVFVTFTAFLRDPEFEHSVGIIPDGVVEQRVFPVAAFRSFPLSQMNQQLFHSLVSPYFVLTFDTTYNRHAPRINRMTMSPNKRPTKTGVASRHIAPWATFGARPADAVLLNTMAYNDDVKTWELPSIDIYTWPVADSHTVYLSLKSPFRQGDEFASMVQANGTWSIHLAASAHPSAPSRALPFQRTLAIVLWPALFHKFLSAGGISGVFLFWLCTLTTGYAALTVAITQWLIRKDTAQVRGRGAARRWEEEGWADMGVAPVVRLEDHASTKMGPDA